MPKITTVHVALMITAIGLIATITGFTLMGLDSKKESNLLLRCNNLKADRLWEERIKKDSGSKSLHTLHALHALQIGLCYKMSKGGLTEAESLKIFENAREAFKKGDLVSR